MFSGVSTEVLTSIVLLLIDRRFPKHKTIVEEGASGDYMYIIADGRVKVTKLSGDGREKILELLEVGDFFGEMSLFDEAPRSASVKAMSLVRILALARNDFLRLLSSSPDLALSVIQELIRRQGQVATVFHPPSASLARVMEAAGAEALCEGPHGSAVFKHQQGQGHTLFLNFRPLSYRLP